MWIAELEVADHILDKLDQKHGVSFAEVQEACFNRPAHFARRTRDGLTLLYSRTEGGRYLQVVLAPRGGGIWAVATARDMDASERRAYQQPRGRRGC